MKTVRWAVVRSGVPLVALWVALGCASPQGKGSQAASEREGASTPEEIEALFSREKDVPEAREASAPDGAWTAQFPSDAEVLVTTGEGYAQAEFSLGTEAKTRCMFYAEPIDAGQTIGLVLAGLKKKATLEKIVPYRMTAVRGIPVVFLEARYAIEASNGKQAGSLKLAISPRLQTPVLCFLDEPGYAEAFASATTQVLTTIKTKEAESESAYSEVWTSSIDGQVFGFQWLQMFEPEAGKRTTVSLAATFIPSGPGELAVHDEVEVLESDASGVFEGTFTESQGGDLTYDLALKRSGKSKYTVSGKLKGNDFTSEFSAPQLADDVAFYRLLRQSHKKTTKLKTTEFIPSLDPKTPAQMTYEVDGKVHTVATEMQGMKLVATLNEDGLMRDATMKVGEREIKQEIIHRSGKF